MCAPVTAGTGGAKAANRPAIGPLRRITGTDTHSCGACDWSDECLGWWRGDPYVFPAGFAEQEHVLGRLDLPSPEYPEPEQDRVEQEEAGAEAGRARTRKGRQADPAPGSARRA